MPLVLPWAAAEGAAKIVALELGTKPEGLEKCANPYSYTPPLVENLEIRKSGNQRRSKKLKTIQVKIHHAQNDHRVLVSMNNPTGPVGGGHFGSFFHGPKN